MQIDNFLPVEEGILIPCEDLLGVKLVNVLDKIGEGRENLARLQHNKMDAILYGMKCDTGSPIRVNRNPNLGSLNLDYTWRERVGGEGKRGSGRERRGERGRERETDVNVTILLF